MKKSPKRFTKKEFFLLLFSIAFSLLLAEVILRVVMIPETKRLAVYDKDLGWRGEPDGEGVYIRRQDNIRTVFQYNEHGFRDDPFPTPKDSALRIVFAGDSFVEALEVDYENTFQETVERRLQASIDEEAAVVVLASQGYSTAQALLAVRKYRARIEPDVILLIFHTANDFADNTRAKFAYLDDAGTLQFTPNQDSWLTIKYLTLQRWFYQNSFLVFRVKNALESFKVLKVRDTARKRSPKSKDRTYRKKITTHLLNAMKTDAQRQETPFGVVILPGKGELAKNKTENPQIVAQFCEDHQIPCLDLWPVLAPHHFFEHDGHINKPGHAVVAQAIYDFLLAEFEPVRQHEPPPER